MQLTINGKTDIPRDAKADYVFRNGKLYSLNEVPAIHNNKTDWLNKNHPLTRTSATKADSKSNLDVLKLLYMQGCPWNEDTCAYAAQNGHLHTLKYAREQDCPWIVRKKCSAEYYIQHIIYENHLTLLQWLNPPQRTYICNYAALYGQINILRWAHENGYPLNQWTYESTARNKHLNILQYIYEQDCLHNLQLLTKWASISASNEGHLHILQWLHARGCPKSRDVCICAVDNGHLHILKWLFKIGYLWYDDIYNNATRAGHLHIIKWLDKIGGSYNQNTCMYAGGYGHLHILKYFHARGYYWDERICKFTTDIDIRKWIAAQPDDPCGGKYHS